MVEWRKIGDLGSYYGGLTGKTKKDFEDGNAKFITYMNVFANPSLDESTVGMVHINEGEKQNKVQKGDILFTGSSETPDEAGMSCVITEDLLEDYYMNSFCFGLRLNNPEQFSLHYLKHLLRSYSIRNAISKTASGVTRFNISKARFGNILIPVPSIDEQHCIVGILDTFTAAIDNLKQQIEQRCKQYEYYRNQLLDLEGEEGVEMKTLGEVASFSQGIQVPLPDQSIVKLDGYSRFLRIVDYTQGSEAPRYVPIDDKRYWISKDEIAIVRYGTPGFVCRGYEGILANNLFKVVVKNSSELGYSFLAFVLKSNQFQSIVKQKSSGGALKAISFGIIRDIRIPVPSLAEQSRIVGILDTFEASIANLEQQLEMREKQYEYYRNKLFTFE
jgi:type I restriction enzyme S subunit